MMVIKNATRRILKKKKKKKTKPIFYKISHDHA